jgi:signal transduction histidine kinase
MAGELQQEMASLEHLSGIRIAFVAAVRHELQTSLTLIKGVRETLEDGQ